MRAQGEEGRCELTSQHLPNTASITVRESHPIQNRVYCFALWFIALPLQCTHACAPPSLVRYVAKQ